MGRWTKAYERNDWGSVTVVLGPPLKTAYGTLAADPGAPELKPGIHKVRWPDGTEATVEVVARRESQRVSDHGHSYDVESNIPRVLCLMNGAKVLLSATDFEFWVEE